MLLRVFFGGSRSPETMTLDDDGLLALVRAELKAIFGIEATPATHRIYRWWNANPQYDLGHLERIAALEAALPAGHFRYRQRVSRGWVARLYSAGAAKCGKIGGRIESRASMTGMKTTQSEALFEQAKQLIPGGVNSPVRAFLSVGGVPRFIERGEGAYIWDADGNRYLDYVLSWGPLVLGHAHLKVVEALHEAITRGTSYGAPTALENELAQLVIDTVPSIEMIRFVNSGTEATMSALRLARAYTGRDKIVKFAGCYHGHADMLLVQAGSGVATLGLPDSPGVPASTTANTLTAAYNDLEAVRAVIQQYRDNIAAVIVEPIAANMGFVMPQPGFLQGLQDLCHAERRAVHPRRSDDGLSRLARRRAKGLETRPRPHLPGQSDRRRPARWRVCGETRDHAEVAPAGTMYQAGTLSGNPLAMTAGLATIRALLEPGVQKTLEQQTAQLVKGICDVAHAAQIPIQADHAGSMFGFYFLKEAGMSIQNYADAKRCADTERYKRFFHAMLDAGFYFAPSQFEAAFMSAAHDDSAIQATLSAMHTALAVL